VGDSARSVNGHSVDATSKTRNMTYIYDSGKAADVDIHLATGVAPLAH